MRRVRYRLFDLTGFQDKKLWDFLGLLIVPIVIALAGWWLSDVSTRRQQEIEDRRAQDSLLQSYIQDMTNLLLNRGLATSKPDSLIAQVARANTLSAIPRLDSRRNRILLRFLSDSNLLSSGSVALLSGAELIRADLMYADLSGAELIRADLSNANLSGASLSDANLFNALLFRANLSNANLEGANLKDAWLTDADLKDAWLNDADLRGAAIGTDLSGVSLEGANLSGAYLRDADLGGANLSGAELSDANVTNNQLAQAASLVGATLPNGTILTEEGWEEFKKDYRK